MTVATSSSVEIRGPLAPEHATLLSAQARDFLGDIVREYRPGVKQLWREREQRQQQFDAGELPAERPESAALRTQDWTVADLPAALTDRRVELTGPAQRKTLINGLNAPVQGFVADLEDALVPTWPNQLDALSNLRDAVSGDMEHVGDEARHYRLNPDPATLHLRPRGWHLSEKHLYIDGQTTPAALFDLALFLFHCAPRLAGQGRGPYLYLPKLESAAEARFCDELLGRMEADLGLPAGAVKCTVLIETLPAAFEMHEILHALRARAVALNAGRWNFLASHLRCLREHPDRLLPDREALDMRQSFLATWSRLICDTSHRRGALAIAGAATELPIRNDDAAHAAAMAQMRADKARERRYGYDGTWIAHPDLAAEAAPIFAAALEELDPDTEETRQVAGMLTPAHGEITEAGLRHNVSIGIQYLQAWLAGQGCVPLYNRMEDAATADLARLLVWQWLHRPQARLDDGREIDGPLIEETISEELENIRTEVGEGAYSAGRYADARSLFTDLCFTEPCADYLTVAAYELLD